jgi:hypothetical protein
VPIGKILSRRELKFALVEKTLGSPIKIDNLSIIKNKDNTNIKSIKLPRGTLMHAIVSVNVNDIAHQKPKEELQLTSNPLLASTKGHDYIGDCEFVLKKSLLVLNITSDNTLCKDVVTFPTYVLTSITKALRKADLLVDQLISATTFYRKIRQDAISYFVPIKSGTLLIMVIKVDYGADLPHWALNGILTVFGIKTMNSLQFLGSDPDPFNSRK